MSPRSAGPAWARSSTTRFVAITCLQAAFLVPFRYFPSEDGPANLASARIIADYSDLFRRYFTLDLFPKFDMLWQLPLAALVEVLPPLVAERVLVLGLVIGLPLAGRYAIRAVRPDADAVSYLLLPISIGWFLHAGYHGFVLSLVLFFLVVGYRLRHRDGGLRTTVVLALLLLLTYLSHVVTFGMVVGFLCLEAAWRALTEGTDDAGTRAGPEDRWGHALRAMVPVLVAAVPSLLLLAAYLVTHDIGSGVGWLSPVRWVEGIVTLRPVLASYRVVEAGFGLLFNLLLFVLVLIALRKWAPHRLWSSSHAWLVCALAAGVLYLVFPDRTGSGLQVSRRISVLLVFALILWLAQFRFDRRTATLAVAGSLVVSVGLTALHVPEYRALNRDLDEFTSVASQLPPGSTVVPLFMVQTDEDRPGLAFSRSVQPIYQALGYVVADRDIVDLSHYQGEFSYFITQFRDCVDPFASIGKGRQWIADSPPDVDILGYEAFTQGAGQIDYVLVWGRSAMPPERLTDPKTVALQEQLDTGYELAWTSEPRGLVELYRRTGPTAGGPAPSQAPCSEPT